MASVAFFVTAHGFGHASRACAVAQTLARIAPDTRVELFTGIPQWYFSQSLKEFGYHRMDCDTGPIQKDALTTDLAATLKKLDEDIPFARKRLDSLVSKLQRLHCAMVVCDIAPLGIAAARDAGLPCILIENFTWDWIYAELAARDPNFERFSSFLKPLFASVDLHIQSTPVCRPTTSAKQVNPISRSPRHSAPDTRKALALDPDRPLVFITMGGVPQGHPYVGSLETKFSGIDFVIAGASRTEHRAARNVLMLPPNSIHYHPDLVRAADVVIGKAGYSTIAEVFHAGAPFGYFVRDDSPEMPPLVEFLHDNVKGLALRATGYPSGDWLPHLQDLLSQRKDARQDVENGAIQCARLIVERLAS